MERNGSNEANITLIDQHVEEMHAKPFSFGPQQQI